MNPLFFGSAPTPLYGVHLSPQGPPNGGGVVLCYPFGQEYMRAHRACRQLSLLLAKRGFHVLRFDYHGTGDSSGDIDDASIDRWTGDVSVAVGELRELAGVKGVTVIGLRLGAVFATMACQQLSDIDSLVVWDPIVDGAAYLAEIKREITSEIPNSYSPPSGSRAFPDGTLHYNGFAMPAPLCAALSSLRLDAIVPTTPRHVFQLVSHETPEFLRLRDAWRALPSYRYQFTPAPHDWNFVDQFGGILLPQPAIQAIVEWMAAREER